MIKKLSEKINFVNQFGIFGAIGLVFCLVGIVAIVLLPFGTTLFNLDIDFVGGTTMQYNMHINLDKPELDEISGIVEGVIGERPSTVQKAGDGTEVVIKTKAVDTETRDKIFDALAEKYNLTRGEAAAAPEAVVADATTTPDTTATDATAAPDATATNATATPDATATDATAAPDATATDATATPDAATEEVAPEPAAIPSDILATDNVDPVMGVDLRNAAIISALLAVLLMLIYISIRFNFRSGFAAVAALVHDILVMLGAYVVFQIPMNMTFIAAALTILGYSINATIVIFDRIRENIKLMRKASFGEIVNVSIWSTVTRSLNTTITTLLPLVMLIILGVDSVRAFAIPLTVGVIAGMYSSVFISGPIWARLGKKTKRV